MTNNSINSNMPIEVAKGGTGAATLTQYSPLIGHGSSPIGVITPGTNGQLLVAATGSDPAFATITSPNSSVSFITGAGTLQIDIPNVTGKITTFAPVLSFGGGSTGITYTLQRCSYQRMGNFVMFTLTILLTSKGTSTGAAAFTLPITTATGKFAASIINVANITFSGQLLCYCDGASAYLFDSVSASAATAITDANFANNTNFSVSGCYLV